MNQGIYPVLDPPAHLTDIGPHRNWPIELAQENYDWVMSVRNRRISELLEFFGFSPPERGQEYDLLLALGERVAIALCTKPNFRETPGKKELAAPGLSMAYDMGLLVGELIIASSQGVVKWELFRDEPQSPDYNLPVLVGRKKDWEFGLLRGCLVEAKAILRGEESNDIWARIYRGWLNRLTSEQTEAQGLRPGSKLSLTDVRRKH